MCLHHSENDKIIILRYTTILLNLYMESVISTFMEYFGYSGLIRTVGLARSEPDGTWWRTGGEVKGKDANGVGSQ